MIKRISFIAAMLLSSVAFAENYQVTYGWSAPTWLPSDTPAYAIQYRLAGGTPVVLANTAIPGGSFSFSSAPGVLLEACPQNRNGALVTPNCTLPAHWVAIGNTNPAPTIPPSPGGFSATLIRVE